MKITETPKGVKIEDVRDLSLAETLDCGQAFRWQACSDNGFTGVVANKCVTVHLNNGILTIDGATKQDVDSLWFNYFDLELDYAKLRSEFAEIHPILKEATTYAPGIRLLCQDSWETLCSFIISQNNNIPRIKGIIERLSESFGEKICDGKYSFPSADVIAGLTVEDLAPLRSGFRAPYILDAAAKVASGEVNLQEIKKMDTDEARAQLMKIKGVGPKVADCTMLFGMHKVECFPMDVWMKRAMKELFPTLTISDFGKYGGIAQQYIFHYSRMNPNLFEK